MRSSTQMGLFSLGLNAGVFIARLFILLYPYRATKGRAMDPCGRVVTLPWI